MGFLANAPQQYLLEMALLKPQMKFAATTVLRHTRQTLTIHQRYLPATKHQLTIILAHSPKITVTNLEFFSQMLFDLQGLGVPAPRPLAPIIANSTTHAAPDIRKHAYVKMLTFVK